VTAQPRSEARARPRVPWWIIAIALLGAAIFLVLPLLGLLVRAPWGSITAPFRDPDIRETMRLSLECSIAATAVSAVFGIPLAFLLARVNFRGRSIVRAAALLPMVLPPVVGGVALLLAFGRRGLAGQYLDQWFGITLPFTTQGAILAETFVSMPFLVITVEGALRGMDLRLERAARAVGARPFTVLRRVTLPAIRSSLLAGLALTWARALGEFGATITFAGNYPGTTQTMPIAVYLALENNQNAAIALSLVLLAVSLVVLALLGGRIFEARTAYREST
jgi:molybdate transport system permease protein